MTVDVPVCPRHRHQWVISTGIVIFILISITAMMITYGVAHQEIEQRVGGNSFLGVILLVIASLVVMIIAGNRKVRATKIDAYEIQLAGVDAGFAEVVKENQRIEREAERARRKAKRDAEPVYDDDPPA